MRTIKSVLTVETRTSREVVKRMFDLALASIGLLIASPVLAVLAVWIKSDSPGPVFYKALRAGRLGKPFWILKLRTMTWHSDSVSNGGTPGNGRVGTRSDDPRITRVGRVLRRCKLDELPQLINVLQGDMSIVGPRPEVVEEIDNYSQEEYELLTVRPGMTDSASIKYWNEAEMLLRCSDQEQAYYRNIRPDKVRLRLEYVRNNHLRTDLRILFQTFKHFVLVICNWVRAAGGGSSPHEISYSDAVFRTRTGSGCGSPGGCGPAANTRRS